MKRSRTLSRRSCGIRNRPISCVTCWRSCLASALRFEPRLVRHCCPFLYFYMFFSVVRGKLQSPDDAAPLTPMSVQRGAKRTVLVRTETPPLGSAAASPSAPSAPSILTPEEPAPTPSPKRRQVVKGLSC